MELTQLRYFYEAAKCGHITRAAQKLHIAQPALTQSIRRLEAELGVRLFERCGRSVALSECGRHLYRRISPLLGVLDELPQELLKLSELERKTIKVNIIAASMLMTELIIEYKRLCPEVNFHLHQSADEESCDCTITTAHHGIRSVIPARALFSSFTEEIRLAVPADSDYARQSSITLADARDEGFISLYGSKPLHSICDAFCRTVGFTPRVIFESDSPAMVRDLIGAGLGVGFWPAYTWGNISSENVRVLPISSPDCRRELNVICNSPDSAAAAEFYEFICRRIGEISEAAI